MSLCDVQSAQQPSQFRPVDLPHFLFRLRPTEHFLFKPFLPETESVSFPIQDFDDIPSPVTENIEAVRKRIHTHPGLDKDAQGADGLAHVRDADFQVHSHPRDVCQHELACKEWIILPKLASSLILLIAIRNPDGKVISHEKSGWVGNTEGETSINSRLGRSVTFGSFFSQYRRVKDLIFSFLQKTDCSIPAFLNLSKIPCQ